MASYDIMLYATYALTVIGTVLSIVLPLLKSLDDPKGLVKSGIGILGIAVLFFIAYSISGNEVAPKFEGDPFNLTPGMSQAIGGMLVTTYVLSVVTILAIFVAEMFNSVK